MVFFLFILIHDSIKNIKRFKLIYCYCHKLEFTTLKLDNEDTPTL
jgi:hypothetical protein